MPKRPRQHVTDELAQRLFHDALPPEWVINPLGKDYSKDYLVEVTTGENVTGNIFIVQLKGFQTRRVDAASGNVAIQIKREHLHYYMNECRLPVFVVGVDVKQRTAYFAFAQGQIELDPGLLANPHRQKVSFRISPENRLADTRRLLIELERAWKFIRDKYPGSVVAAAQHRAKLLEKLDPRFRVDVSYVNGQEKLTFYAKEPVQFSLRVSGKKRTVDENIKAFFHAGLPLKSSENLQLHVDGSPGFLLNEGKIAAIVQVPHRPVEVLLFVKAENGQCIYSPEFKGNLEGGFTHHSFHGELPDCPLSLDFDVQTTPNSGGKVKLHWHFGNEAWIGRRLFMVPWLEGLHALFHAAAAPDIQLGLLVRSQGNELLNLSVPRPQEAATVLNCRPYLDLLRHARDICRKLQLECSVPEKWSDEDLLDVRELHALTNLGHFELPRMKHLEFVCSPSMFPRDAILSGKGALQLRHEHRTYSFLGQEFDFAETYEELSEWREAKLFDLEEHGVQKLRVELFDVRVNRIWPRFQSQSRATPSIDRLALHHSNSSNSARES